MHSGLNNGKDRVGSSAWTVHFEVFVWYASNAGESAMGDTSVKLRGGVQAGDESLVSLIHRCIL